MQCPSCGFTDLRPNFNWCPKCGIPLQRAQKILRKVEHGERGVETTLPQQSAALTSENGDLGLNNSSIQGKFNINLLGLYYPWPFRIRYFIKA